MSQALRGKVSSPMMKYSTCGLWSTSDPARGNQWCYPLSFALAHYTGKSGFQNWIKYQTKKMYIRHPLWLAGQGSGIPCVKVFAPPSSGISDRDVFPVYGAKVMGYVPPLPESLLYLLVFGESGTCDKLVMVVPINGITHLRNESVYS